MKISKLQLAREAFKHKGFIPKIPYIFRMLKAIFKKEYKPEYKNVIVPALVIIYLISPLNISTEWIPFLGQIDDIALISLALPMLMKEVDRFIVWEAKKQQNPEITDAEIIE